MAANNNPRWSLSGMTALVTGGTFGIGSAIVEELAGLGATVYTCARNEADLNQALQEWDSRGIKSLGWVCDVISMEDSTQLMAKVSSAVDGKLDILIINSGALLVLTPSNSCYSAEQYHHLKSTNLESCHHISQLAYPLLKASGMGSVVFVSTGSSLLSVHLATLFAATKDAIDQVTKNLAREWAKDNIRVNAIVPWLFKTASVEGLLSVKQNLEKVLARTPMERVGKAEEVSSLVAYLCLPEASYITGQATAVYGGFSASGLTWF